MHTSECRQRVGQAMRESEEDGRRIEKGEDRTNQWGVSRVQSGDAGDVNVDQSTGQGVDGDAPPL
eukprot:2556783-Lingulodinium_polyedra.AAC.1